MPWEEKPFSLGYFVFSVSRSLIRCQRSVFNAGWTQFFHTYLCEKFQLLHRFDNSCLVRYRYLIKFFSLVTLERNNSCQFCCSFVFFSQFHHPTLFHFLNDNTTWINQISLVLVILEQKQISSAGRLLLQSEVWALQLYFARMVQSGWE